MLQIDGRLEVVDGHLQDIPHIVVLEGVDVPAVLEVRLIIGCDLHVLDQGAEDFDVREEARRDTEASFQADEAQLRVVVVVELLREGATWEHHGQELNEYLLFFRVVTHPSEAQADHIHALIANVRLQAVSH